MKSTPPKNVAHSVRDRLLKLARSRQEDFNFVLVRYFLERLLYRISRSPHEAEFILKGAMLFMVWSKHAYRATKDLDLLGSGTPDLDRLVRVFREVAVLPVEDDGIVFDPARVQARRIKEDAEYEGVRVTLEGRLGSAKLALQVDVGFGDSVTPAPTTIDFPTLLPFPSPIIRAYARETVVAEKLHAMVDLGMANSRMKDFFDVWFLSTEFEFQGVALGNAIRATFERRQTPIPEEAPAALTEAFALNAAKQSQWSAFLGRSAVAVGPKLTLPEVVAAIAPFLIPAIEEALSGGSVQATWPPGGQWIFR
ncbi:MAG TPA: nucleotidyl transferase AbiEii/AbiGii toxin family protein [Polyangiaceae bacterium]|nr:nucleotidyl transferase AbiEii/AbiGii toxin family protein [Polyangiaceae bacterium]